jgi:hypothetical protein
VAILAMGLAMIQISQASSRLRRAIVEELSLRRPDLLMTQDTLSVPAPEAHRILAGGQRESARPPE